MNKLIKFLLLIVAGSFILAACSDELNTVPSDTVSQSQITELAEANPEAIAEILEPQMAGMFGHLVAYNSMGLSSVRHSDHGIKSIFHMADMMGEDVVQTSGSYGWYWHEYLLNVREKDYITPRQMWQYLYQLVKMANDIIIQIPEDTEDVTLKAYRGQALVTRAYSYHILVQLFQKTYKGNESAPGVPLILEVPNEDGNPRAPMSDIYAQMVEDLTNAVNLLDGYARPSKAFIDQNVAYGYLARVYLSMEEWQKAADAAKAARTGYQLMSGEEYLDGFKYINNREWMFGSIITADLPIVQSGIVNHFSFFSSFSYGYASLTAMHKAIDKRLYDHMSETDFRKQAYQAPDLSTFEGGYNNVALPAYTNGKFGASDDGADNTQDLVYMRAAEMYLIEAEALAALGQNGPAGDVLAALMSNRDPNYTVPGSGLLEEIRKQRRIELWGELGYALFDIKRLKQGINRAYAGSNHPEDAQLVRDAEDWDFTYQLPNSEIDNNVDITPADNNP